MMEVGWGGVIEGSSGVLKHERMKEEPQGDQNMTCSRGARALNGALGCWWV